MVDRLRSLGCYTAEVSLSSWRSAWGCFQCLEAGCPPPSSSPQLPHPLILRLTPLTSPAINQKSVFLLKGSYDWVRPTQQPLCKRLAHLGLELPLPNPSAVGPRGWIQRWAKVDLQLWAHKTEFIPVLLFINDHITYLCCNCKPPVAHPWVLNERNCFNTTLPFWDSTGF